MSPARAAKSNIFTVRPERRPVLSGRITESAALRWGTVSLSGSLYTVYYRLPWWRTPFAVPSVCWHSNRPVLSGLPCQICVVFVCPDDSIVILMFTLGNTNNERNDHWTTQLFYTTSNRVGIILINVINLLWRLLTVSVLEVELSDWPTSRDHRRFIRPGAVFYFLFLTDPGFQGQTVRFLVTDGRGFSQSERVF